MPPRRGAGPTTSSSSSSLTSPSTQSFPRAGSPSGISSFFSKPARWFGHRTTSNPRVPSIDEPRPSFTSFRKPTISHPTDPRPIVGSSSESGLQPSRSVLDLSISEPPINDDRLSPGSSSNLRGMGHKNWSRSMDDLSKLLSKPSSSNPLSIQTPAAQQSKIDAYRSHSPTTPTDPHQSPNYPFPAITSSSSSPPGHSHWSPGNAGATLAPPPNGHIHSRSHSSALSSKASNSSLHPPGSSSGSPRKVSPINVEKPAASFSGLGGFAFHFGSRSQTNLHEKPASPQTESQPKQHQRSSQIIHHSGFLNRHPIPSHPSELISNRGWKSFKAELRGTKIYFYKPPTERAHGIKDLFPSGLVSLAEDEEEPPDEPMQVYDERRRKRAFWGPGQHPEIWLDDDGRIVRGSGAALVYEMLFRATFLSDNPDSETRWKAYCEVVLLSLPSLMGQSTFEAEFRKFASHLLSSTAEGGDVKPRVEWLVTRYETIHRTAHDLSIWDEWKKELNLSAVTSPVLSSLPISPAASDLTMRSPNPSRFSTLPASGSLSSEPLRSNTLGTTTKSKAAAMAILTALERQGLTRETFLQLDTHKITKSLGYWNQVLLPNAKQMTPGEAVITSNTGGGTGWATFGGSEAVPHWLTRQIVMHLLGSSATFRERSSIDSLVSKTHQRASVIQKWIDVAEQCRTSGDECSWKAIVQALCSKPVARLDKAWKRVDIDQRTIVESWCKGLKLVHKSRKKTPWTGDIMERVSKLLEDSKGQDEDWKLDPLREVHSTISRIASVWDSCGSDSEPRPDADEETVALLDLWRKLSSIPPPKITHIDAYLVQSFAVEPIQRGRFNSSFWNLRPAIVSSHPLAPLVFPEALPNITFLDGNSLIRLKKDSVDGVSLDVKQIRHVSRMISLPNTDGDQISWAIKEPSPADLGETMIQLFDGELVLKISRETAASRPASTIETTPATPSTTGRGLSRGPSIRVSPSPASALERKSSAARRQSLPSLSARNSHLLADVTPSMEGSLRGVIHWGSVERLVNILINGLEGVTVAVADDNGEMPLSEGRSRNVRFDREDFARIWWSFFPSFVTPLVFFELLAKQYVNVQTSVASQSWDRGQPHSRESDQTAALRRKLDTLSVLSEWIDRGSGAQAFLDDINLYKTVKAFLYDATLHSPPTDTDPTDLPAWGELAEARKSLISLFTLQTLRPTLKLPHDEAVGSSNTTHGARPPQIDRISPDQLVDNLDAVGAAIFRLTTPQDFFALVDLLEVQTADKTGWCASIDAGSNPDDLVVSTIHTYVHLVAPSSQITEMGPDTIFKHFPTTLRSAFRAHTTVKDWIISKIAEPGIGLRVRQHRMELFLQALVVGRARSARVGTESNDPLETPLPRSFVEAAITAALLSPESRAYYRAWHNIAMTRGTGVDSIAALASAPPPPVYAVVPERALTIDVGWLVERLLEIISLPDTISGQVGQNLVNLDKRRHLCNIILNTPSLVPPRAKHRQHRDNMDQENVDRLNLLTKQTREVNMDLRIIREDAYQENFQAQQAPGGKRMVRPFGRHTVAQQDKIKRDKLLRDRLTREKRLEQSRTEKRGTDMDKATNPSIQAIKHQKGKRSMSAFLRVVRPLSTAWGYDKTSSVVDPPQAKRRTAAELDFVPSSKPTLVLDLGDAKVKQYPNDQRSFTFQLDTEDGGHYLLQSPSSADMSRWMIAISKMSKTTAEKRRTYIGNSLPTPEHLGESKKGAANSNTAVYGVELEVLIRRENDGQIPEGTIPNIVESCLREVEGRGMTEVGIYRISGTVTAINSLKAAFDSGDPVDMNGDDAADINAVCGALKAWFRQLPGGLFPGEHYGRCVNAMNREELDDKLQAIREVARELPIAHFSLLRRLMEHLERVTDYSEQNQMTAMSLAIVFGPSILSAPGQSAMANLSFVNQLTRTLISHFHVVFADPEPEPDGDSEYEDAVDDEEFIGVPLEGLAEEDEEESADDADAAASSHVEDAGASPGHQSDYDHDSDDPPPASSSHDSGTFFAL